MSLDDCSPSGLMIDHISKAHCDHGPQTLDKNEIYGPQASPNRSRQKAKIKRQKSKIQRTAVGRPDRIFDFSFLLFAL